MMKKWSSPGLSIPPTDPLPLGSRIKQDRSHFEEQQRQRVAQEARAKKKQKKQERELVLKRIAEDRRSFQEKTHASTRDWASSSAPQRLGGRVQTNVDNQCILMVTRTKAFLASGIGFLLRC
ncbi:hypothetical protein GN956_G26908 [Arapaima gigas]